MPTYTPASAAKRLQISASSIRNYTADARFRSFLSPEATPSVGKPRLLCEEDLLVIKFIHNLTRSGVSLDEIANRLTSGELAGSTAEQLGVSQEGEVEARNVALRLLPQAFTAMQTQLGEAQARERQLTDRVIELTGTVGELKGQLAAKEGELERLYGLVREKEVEERPKAEANQRRGLFGRLFRRS